MWDTEIGNLGTIDMDLARVWKDLERMIFFGQQMSVGTKFTRGHLPCRKESALFPATRARCNLRII